MNPIKNSVEMIASTITVEGMGLRTGYPQLDETLRGLAKGELTLVAGRSSMGKSQPITANVLTPKGFVPIGSLKLGDSVIAGNGDITTVTGIFPQGEREVYSIRMSDGSTTRCDGEHLWRAAKSYDRNNFLTVTLNEIKRKLKRGKHNLWSIERCPEVRFWKKCLPLNPYLLGFYIGDGWTKGSSPMFTITQPDKLNKIASLISEEDELVLAEKIDYRVRRKTKEHFKCTQLFKHLLNLGLSGKRSYEKFIPKEYLFSSIEQRKQLLQGLIDTDGYCVNKNWFEYSTSSQELAKDVQFLVRSLGGRCNISSRMGKYKKSGEEIRTRVNYRVFFSFSAKTVKRQLIQEITPDGLENSVCIMVKHPSHLYITDDFIVTHNTALMVDLALNISKEKKVGIFSLEMSEQQLVERMLSNIQKTSLYDLKSGKVKVNDETIYKVENLKMWINDVAGVGVDDINKVIDNSHIDFEVIFVDYLQLIRPSGRKSARYEEVDGICQELRNIAKTRNVSMVLLAQLNREAEKRENHRPRLSDLRESGGIEQTADKILFLYRPSYYLQYEQQERENTGDESEAYIIVAKNRNGKIEDVPVVWFPECMKFVSTNWDLTSEF